MYKNTAIINYSIKNNLWNGFRVGTDLDIRVLNFLDTYLEFKNIRRQYLTHYLSSKKTTTSFSESVKISKSKEMPFGVVAEFPDIVKIDLVTDFYLLDKEYNYFSNNYPYVSIDFVRFCKERDKFLANPKNGVVVLPSDASAEFIDSITTYAAEQQKRLFAADLARFARSAAMRLQKLK